MLLRRRSGKRLKLFITLITFTPVIWNKERYFQAAISSSLCKLYFQLSKSASPSYVNACECRPRGDTRRQPVISRTNKCNFMDFVCAWTPQRFQLFEHVQKLQSSFCNINLNNSQIHPSYNRTQNQESRQNETFSIYKVFLLISIKLWNWPGCVGEHLVFDAEDALRWLKNFCSFRNHGYCWKKSKIKRKSR